MFRLCRVSRTVNPTCHDVGNHLSNPNTIAKSNAGLSERLGWLESVAAWLDIDRSFFELCMRFERHGRRAPHMFAKGVPLSIPEWRKPQNK
jgi:hypothetical protein